MAMRLMLTAPRTLAFEEVAHRQLASGEIRLKGLVSGISHGTELNLYRGTAPFFDREFDPGMRAFRAASAARGFPARLGYEMVGEVVEVGPDVTGIDVGDLMHTGTSHAEEAIVRPDGDADFYPPVKLPRDRPERGLFVSLGSVALQAIHDGRIKVADTVVIFGAGVIGLIATQLAKLNGATNVLVVEPYAGRRELAREFGVSTLDPTGAADAIGYAVKELIGHRGADVALETSGTYAGLHGAIASVGIGGTVVAAGYYQGGGADLRLGEEWHHNRPTLVSSMGVWGCPHRDYPLWDRRRMLSAVVDLVYSERIAVDPLLTEVIPFAQAPKAYERLDVDPGSALKIALAYGTRATPAG